MYTYIQWAGEINIIISIVHCPAHTPRFARTQCFGVFFFMNPLFSTMLWLHVGAEDPYDDKAVYIHILYVYVYVLVA